uniref:Mor transcription activator family protein n=1 Tax=Candidatus Kentrum sp. TC TaxID=2126339 RepID=A0A450YYL4_9GAMM|nr:MAG: Mor transcription activator family protein [Candidatus Kentron sp. TC]
MTTKPNMCASLADTDAVLRDMAERISRCFQLILPNEVDKELAEYVGHEVANGFADHWGGQNIYIPKGRIQKIHARNEEIWRSFDGANHADLALRYGVSTTWIYHIVKVMRKIEQHKRQIPLPL